MTLRDEQVRAFLDAAPDAMVIVDDAGTIVFANAQAQALFGYAPAQLVGRGVEVLLPERFRSRHRSHRQGFLALPRARPMGGGLQLYGLRADGSEFPAEISLSPVQTEGGLFIASAVRDITDRKAVEDQMMQARQEAERANRAKSAFLAAASHDLRQPVQALNLLNSVLRRSVPADSATAGALMSQDNILRVMSDLLNSLLDVSKLEAGMVEPNVEDCRVREIFASLRIQFAELAEEKGLALVVAETDDMVRTDGKLLTRVLQNLVANAIRYTARGSVELRCTPTAGTVRIEVADTGIGIPVGELDIIFEDFYQSPPEGRRNKGGFGLGLGIVRRLTELLHHPLEVDSTFGVGSRFTLRVPKGRAACRPQPAVPSRPEDAEVHAGSLVVIIDDDAAVAAATALLLEVVGYQVVVAADGEQAVGQLRELEAAPDLLICDFHLSGKASGLDAIDGIRNHYGDAMPAILVSGDTSAAVSAEARQVENCRVMNKPVDGDLLLAVIPDLLARHAQRPDG